MPHSLRRRQKIVAALNLPRSERDRKRRKRRLDSESAEGKETRLSSSRLTLKERQRRLLHKDYIGTTQRPKRRSRAKMYQTFSVGSKVIRNNCAKEGEPGDEANDVRSRDWPCASQWKRNEVIHHVTERCALIRICHEVGPLVTARLRDIF